MFQKPLDIEAHRATLQLWGLFTEPSSEVQQCWDIDKRFTLLQDAARVITKYPAAH